MAALTRKDGAMASSHSAHRGCYRVTDRRRGTGIVALGRARSFGGDMWNGTARTSRSLGASRACEFSTVVVPAAAPHIVAGIRLGVTLAFLSLVAAELTGASSGLGYRLQEARQYIRPDRMFAILIELGLVGALIDLAVGAVARRVVHWEGA